MLVSCNHNSAQCILETIKAIEATQNSKKMEHCCKKYEPPLDMKPNSNTIPIMLICQGTCDFFIGSGVFKCDKIFECFKTPVFRVSRVIEDFDARTCVELELLQPQSGHGSAIWCEKNHDVCSFFAEKRVEKFVRTGVKIKVDLGCFCGIELLQDVEAHRGKPVSTPPPKKVKIIQEEICGNFGPGIQTVWEERSLEILQGTFQIFNSAHSISPVEGLIDAHKPIAFPPILMGTTVSRSTAFPTSFTIKAPDGTNGKYCINLTKAIYINC